MHRKGSVGMAVAQAKDKQEQRCSVAPIAQNSNLRSMLSPTVKATMTLHRLLLPWTALILRISIADFEK